MTLPSPKRFSSNEEFSNICLDVWKISTPSLSWSILLSYLISAEETGTWTLNYELLLDTEHNPSNNAASFLNTNFEHDKTRIKELVKEFNPFLNNSLIYSDEIVTRLFNFLDLKLHGFENNSETRNNVVDNESKIKAAAKMLECQIVLVITDCAGKANNATSYGFRHKRFPKIVIFLEENFQKAEKQLDAHAFGMNLKYSDSLRIDAIKYLLNYKIQGVPYEDIDQIVTRYKELQGTCVPFYDNFLHYMLRNWKYIVPKIYKPPYLARKFAEAGFETNPCCVGEDGLSAFGFCLIDENSHLFNIFYKYAVNNFQKTDASVRNPNENILRCLKEVGDSLRLDKKKLSSKVNDNDSCDMIYKKSLKRNQEILSFNEYQLLCIQEIYGVPRSQKIEPVQRKHNIISLLTIYMEYRARHQADDSFENHIEYNYYYKKLDSFTCILFFDNILLLNPTPNINDFKNTVLNMFLTVLSYYKFPIKCVCKVDENKDTYWKKDDEDEFLICESTCMNNGLNFLPFFFRKQIKTFGIQYIANLENDTNNASPDINKTLQNVRLCLQDFPRVTDEFLVTRLKRYLEPIVSDFRAGLTLSPYLGYNLKELTTLLLNIERALQVIGETLCTSSKVVIGHLVSSCFPNDTVHSLVNIRNQCLSHYRPNVMYGRMNLENDTVEKYAASIRGFRKALINFNDELQIIYLSLEFRIEECLMSHAENDARENISNEMLNHILGKKQSIHENRKSGYQKRTNDIIRQFHYILNYIEYFVKGSKFEKSNKLPNISTLLEYFTDFETKQCDSDAYNKLLHYVQNLKRIHSNYEIQKINLKQGVFENIQKQRLLIRKALTYTNSDSTLTYKKYSEFLKSKYTLKLPDQVIYGVKVKEYFKRFNSEKTSLMKLLQSSCPSKEKLKKLLIEVSTDNKNKEIVSENSQTDTKKALQILENINGPNINFKNIQEVISTLSELEDGTELLLIIMKLIIENDKYQNDNAIENYLSPLNFVSSFLEHIKCVSPELDKLCTEFSNYSQELKNLLDQSEKNNDVLKENVVKNISELRNILSKVIPNTDLPKGNPYDISESSIASTCEKFSEFQHSFESIRKHFENVKNFKWFTDEDLDIIGTIVTERLTSSNENIDNLIEVLESNPSRENKSEMLLKDKYLSIKNKLLLAKLSPAEALRTLKGMNNHMVYGNITTFSKSVEGMNLLLRLQLPGDLDGKMFRFLFLNNKLEYLLRRIRHMKVITLEGEDEFFRLWKNFRSGPEFLKYIRYYMIRNYGNDMGIRSALEMLLFDCMNILEKRKDLQQFWTKYSNLFSGVNLRDVLAHGSTIMEVVGGLLDPEDLPSQLIGKILELIDDGEVLQKVSDHWKETRTSDLNILKSIVDKHVSEKNLKEEELQEEMKKWNGYLSLLPLEK